MYWSLLAGAIGNGSVLIERPSLGEKRDYANALTYYRAAEPSERELVD